MKKVLLFFFLLALAGTLIPRQARSQSVAINADSSAPDPSAILDLKSVVKGFLAPRMTLAQRNAIAAPAVGLLVYQTDNNAGFYCYSGSAWNPVTNTGGGGSGPDPFWSDSANIIRNANTGSVHVRTSLGVGGDSASASNTVQIGDVGKTGFVGNDLAMGNGNQVTAFNQYPTAFQVAGNTDFVFLPNAANPDEGHFGIGTSSPLTKLQVGDVQNELAGGDFGIGNSRHSTVFTQFDSYLNVVGNADFNLFPQKGAGHVGINTTGTIANKLQIGDVGNSGFVGNDFAIGNSLQVTAFNQYSTLFQIAGNTDINLVPQANTANGHVGINATGTLANKLQIGGLGTIGFAGNDFAIGNGAQATAFNQYPTVFQIASSTDLALMPATGAGRRLGVNTTTPRAILDVEGSVSLTAPNSQQSYAYLGLTFNGSFQPAPDLGGYSYASDISIIASNNIMALQLDTYSDARIKKIIGRSNGLQDLKTLKALQVTDYSYKDKIKYGNKILKKVIAQQVEQVYPQVVSKHRDVVPNVFQPTSTIEAQPDGNILLTFKADHHISSTAKRLQVIFNDSNDKKYVDIVSIPSPNQVLINASDLKKDKLFVYGEEVDDFRTVDYDGLTTLNISATQELSKELQQLQQALAKAQADMRIMAREIRSLKHPIVQNRLTSAKQTRKI